jgi:hypothetical protein
MARGAGICARRTRKLETWLINAHNQAADGREKRSQIEAQCFRLCIVALQVRRREGIGELQEPEPSSP